MTKQTISKSRSFERQALAERMRAVAVGETVTYKELIKASGCDVNGKSHHVFALAREDVMADGILFGTIRNVGIRRLTNTEASSDTINSRRHKIRSHAKKGATELGTVIVEELPPGEKLLHQCGTAYFGIVGALSTMRGMKQLPAVMPDAAARLNIGETLSALKNIR